jgi:hypothetical protein
VEEVLIWHVEDHLRVDLPIGDHDPVDARHYHCGEQLLPSASQMSAIFSFKGMQWSR